MPKTARLLFTVSRPEFIPANSASLIIGISWGINPPVALTWELVASIALCASVISLVSAVAAQVNTVSDYDLDLKDSRKNRLVEAMGLLGRRKIRIFAATELLLSLVLVILLLQIQAKPFLFLMWVAGAFLAYAYSAPPIRLKSRSWLAAVALILVLSILPILFVYCTLSSELDSVFLLFLAGQALTVYAVIVPAEIRDYFDDKTMGVETLTVRLGLVRASLLGIALLSAGGLLCGTALAWQLASGAVPISAVSVLILASAYCYLLGKYRRLHRLSKSYAGRESDQSLLIQDITSLAARNPKWITLMTQVIVFACLVLLATKFLF
jgi:4-hydroxybenzoate polyprenyltransferase